MKTANILVTGSKGQLGNELQLLQNDFTQYRFYFTDVAELNITNLIAVEQFCTHHAINAIVNCAAYTAVDKAESEQELARLVNVTAVDNLAFVAEKYHIKLIHISTDYVFDGKHYMPYQETDKVCPQSAYGQTKLEGEQALLSHQLSAAIIRTSWLYSSFGNNFVKTMIKLGKEREQLNVVTDQVGTPTYAADLAKAVLLMLDKIPENGIEIYHYSNEGVCSWYDFAKEIMAMTGISCTINPIPTTSYPTPAKRPYYSVLDKTKIKQHLQLTIPYWKDSLKTCIAKLETAH